MQRSFNVLEIAKIWNLPVATLLRGSWLKVLNGLNIIISPMDSGSFVYSWLSANYGLTFDLLF